MALLKAACSCLTPEGLIHRFQVIRKVPSNNPELRPTRFQLSPKTSGRSWHFPISCLVFPSHALAYLQAFKFLKGRAVLYYTSGQCLTQDGPSLIRVSCDYRSTNTAKKNAFEVEKGSDASFPVSSYLGEVWGRWACQPKARWPNRSHLGMANPLSCPQSAANQTEPELPPVQFLPVPVVLCASKRATYLPSQSRSCFC